MTARPAAILCAFVCLSAPMLAWGEAADRVDAPDFFDVYSIDGHERLSGVCTPNNDAAIDLSCRVDTVRIISPPDSSKKEEVLTNLDKEMAKALKEEGGDQAKLDEEFGKSIAEIRKDYLENPPQETPSRGKKFVSFLRSLAAVESPRDFFELLIDKELRTCKIIGHQFKVDFKRLGPRTWISSAEPVGLCRQATVYELKNPTAEFFEWTLKETRVSAGNTEGVCADAERDLHEPRVWTWDNPNEFELPCDFMSHRIGD